MSQRLVSKLLADLGGAATRAELEAAVEEQYPDRSLMEYLSLRLSAMERDGLIDVSETDGTAEYALTEAGRRAADGASLGRIDADVSREALADRGLDIQNVVASTSLGVELDLATLAVRLPGAEYEPESHPSLIHRPLEDTNVTLMVPASGHLSIVGAKTVDELRLGLDTFLAALPESIAAPIDAEAVVNDLMVENVVASGTLGQEIDLDALALDLGLERTEYEPEAFQGLVYRPANPSTILAYRTGSFVITGANSYGAVLDAYTEFTERVTTLGIDV